MGIVKQVNKGKPSQSVVARNIRDERLSAIYNSVGIVTMFVGTTSDVPPGWLLCDGSEVLQSAYPDLYTLIGTTFGTASKSGYFVLPDFDNRVPIGVLASTGLVTTLGGTFSVDATTASTDHAYLGVYFIIRAY